MEIHRRSMDFVTRAMRFEQCSAYAMEVGCGGHGMKYCRSTCSREEVIRFLPRTLRSTVPAR